MPLGFRAGRYDSRDHMYSIRPVAEDKTRFTIRHDVSVVNQGRIVPCCVSIAVTTCLEVLDKNAATPLSFMYNYYRARPSLDQLDPLDIRQALAAAASYGICARTYHDVSLDTKGAATEPSQAADDNAIRRRVAFNPAVPSWAYQHFSAGDRLMGWRNAIQQKAPVILGFDVTKAYVSIPNTNNTHQLPVNDVGFDGHAVVAMGYDDERDNDSLGSGAFYIRDSRGVNFADKGHWWLPYKLVETHLIVDSWTVLKLTETC